MQLFTADCYSVSYEDTQYIRATTA